MANPAVAALLNPQKGGTATVEPKEETTVVADTDEEEIDLEQLKTHKQLDDLVEQHKIKVPDDWPKKTIPKKKEWLVQNAADDGAETPATEEAPPADQEEAVEIESNEEIAKDVTPSDTGPSLDDLKAAQDEEADDSVLTNMTADQALSSEEFEALVSEIENSDEGKARTKVKELEHVAGQAWFALGGYLSMIRTKEWFKEWGFETFEAYVEVEHGLKKRRANYWIAIYEGVTESKIPFAGIQHLGWTKLALLFGSAKGPVMNKGNWKAWVKKAEKLSVPLLTDEIKKAQAPTDDGSGEGPAEMVTSRSFRFKGEQFKAVDAAVEKAMAASGTKVPSAALEYVCLDFLSGTGAKAKDALVGRMKNAGAEMTLEALQEAFPDLELTA